MLLSLTYGTNLRLFLFLVMEYIRPSLRTMGLNLCIGLFYCLACIAVPWLAVVLKNWRYFLICISVPHLSILGFYFLVPESAQWLISNGKTDKAIRCFERIAKFNGRQLETSAVEGLKKYCSQHVNVDTKHESFLGLLKTPKLRRKTLILIFKS